MSNEVLNNVYGLQQKLTGRLGGRADMNKFAPLVVLDGVPRLVGPALGPILPVEQCPCSSQLYQPNRHT